MSTVILKWNPSFSSYSMLHFLMDIRQSNLGVNVDFNWSVWDHEIIEDGDVFYLLKVGDYGQIGIVGRGVITSDPYPGEDWSGKGRQTFYVDFAPECLINPDVLPILDAATLSAKIPDFEWTGGHSGLVLNENQAIALDGLWKEYLAKNKQEMLRLSQKKIDFDLVYVEE